MKVSYNNTDKLDLHSPSHVVMEIGEYGVSIGWYDKETLSINGVKLYQFKHNSGIDIANHLSEIFKDNLVQDKSTAIFFDFKESTIIPEEFYNIETDSDVLNILFGKKDAVVKSEQLSLLNNAVSEKAFNVYRVEPGINSVINVFYPGCNVYHSSSKQIEKAEKGLTVSIFNNIIKVLLKDEEGFKLIKHFNYKTPLDVAFILLDVCKVYKASPEKIELNLNGMIDIESNLFKEIEKYFKNVNFASPDPDVIFNLQNDEEANHYFSNLTHLIKCVS